MSEATRAEVCVVACAEAFRGDGEILASAMGVIPALGARLARATFEPDLVMTDGVASLVDASGRVEGTMTYAEVFDTLWWGKRHVMMGASQRHPSIGQLQAYERCIEEARREVKKVFDSDFKGGEVPSCLTALSGSLGAEADAVLEGLVDLLSYPGKPGWAAQYIAILKAHNLWISSEAKRLGLLP